MNGPDFQTLFNVALGVISFLLGIIVQGLRESMAKLQKADNDLATKVQSIEVLVAGTYVKRDELDKLANALFAKLDKIMEKMSEKVDKP